MKQSYSHLWNELPQAERERLMPHMLESQIVHIEQCKLKAISAHKKLMKELNEQQKYLEKNVERFALINNGDSNNG